METLDLRVLDIENLENCEVLGGYSWGFIAGVGIVAVVCGGIVAT